MIPDETIKNTYIDEIGPINDYDTWLDYIDDMREKDIHKIYSIITNIKKSKQLKMFPIRDRVKYVMARNDFKHFYGEWDMTDGEGYIYPYGKDIKHIQVENLIHKIINKLNG